MKIANINISETATGIQVMDIPQGAKLQSAVLLSGVVQVYFSYAGDGLPKMPVQFMVVDNHVDYPGDYAYLDMLVNSSTKQVQHVVYKSLQAVQINPL